MTDKEELAFEWELVNEEINTLRARRKDIEDLLVALDEPESNIMVALEQLDQKLDQALQDPDPKQRSKKSVELYSKLAKVQREKDQIRSKLGSSALTGPVQAKFNDLAEKLLRQGFGVLGAIPNANTFGNSQP